MRKTILILTALLICTVGVFAYKPVEIIGKAPFAASNTIRVYQYDDLISYKRIQIGSAKIDKNGDFKISLNLTRSTYLMFGINFLESDLYVEPEETYSIHFEIDKKFANPAEISAKEVPMFTILDDPDFTKLNSLINALENAVSDFLSHNDNFKRIYFRADRVQLDSLKNIIFAQWGNNTGSYFKAYQKYTFASYENIIFSKYPDSAFAKYFNDREFLVENTAFMSFFNSYFEKYYDSPVSQIPVVEFRRIINEEAVLPKLLDHMGKDPKLKNEIIRELVLLKMLQDGFSDDRFEYGNIIKLLYDLSIETKFPDHKKMATNILNQIRNRVNGQDILDLSLKNVSGATTKLSEFKNKYFYIQFFTTDCNTCIRDMYGMQKLMEEYKDSVQFVSISLDINTAKLFHFVNKYPQFNWPILHFANNFEFVERYGLKGLPLTMILDKLGNIVMFPAPTPEDNLTQLFNRIYKDKYHHKVWFEPGHSTIEPMKR